MEMRLLEDMIAQGRSIFDLKLSVVFYARVSTEKDEQLNSLENQKAYYKEFIHSNPNWHFAGGYVDEGITGTSVAKREQFLRMIEDAKNGCFDLIVTKEISRFARNTLDSIGYTRELLRHGVGVFFQNDNINTFDKDAELRLTIMSSIAQDEVRKLSERTRFGFKRAQEHGVLLGQDNLYGYRKRDGRLEIIESEASVVQEVFRRYVERECGLRAIANDLERRGICGRSGKPLTYSSLYGMIRNPKYKGFYAGRRYGTRDYRDGRTYRMAEENWIVHPDSKIPVIVEPCVWDAANRLLAQRGQTMKTHAQSCQNRYAYSGKIICAKHGTTFHRHIYRSKARGEVETWNCKLYRQKGKENGCNSPTIYSDELDIVLQRIFGNIAADKSLLIQEYLENLHECEREKNNEQELMKLEQTLHGLEAKKEKLLELTLNGLLDNQEFKRRNDRYNEEMLKITQRKKALAVAAVSTADKIKRVEKIAKEIERQWDQNHGFVREMSKSLVDHIIVNADSTNTKIQLDVFLSLGSEYRVNLSGRNPSNILSLDEMHISQAQVSRLEKNALERIRKQI